MVENRRLQRAKSILQGRVLYNRRRSSIDCIIRDISKDGARLNISDAVTIPVHIELYIPNRDEYRKADIQWRQGQELGISFVSAKAINSEPEPFSEDVVNKRLSHLEEQVRSLWHQINEMKSGSY